MADIKFMDISENDNPATTDSILVANQQNGVKRTTLGKIGDMFSVHGLLHLENVTVNIPDITKTNDVQIQAPDVEGYKFAFWLQPTTTGTINWCYIENPIASTTNVFSADQNLVGHTSNTYSTYAVYVKSTLA